MAKTALQLRREIQIQIKIQICFQLKDKNTVKQKSNSSQYLVDCRARKLTQDASSGSGKREEAR